jgi:hypothetical protein
MPDPRMLEELERWKKGSENKDVALERLIERDIQIGNSSHASGSKNVIKSGSPPREERVLNYLESASA